MELFAEAESRLIPRHGLRGQPPEASPWVARRYSIAMCSLVSHALLFAWHVVTHSDIRRERFHFIRSFA
jgi:hypothetical protein